MKNSWNYIVPIFFKISLIPVSEAFVAIFRYKEWNWFLQIVNAIPERDLAVLNFVYHLPKRWTDLFSHVNGKQAI